MQELKELTINKQIAFVRIKENNKELKCEAFSDKGYVGDCLLKNKVVIEKVKDHAVLNKIKGPELETIIRDIARLHLKIKSGWTDNL